MSKKSGDGRTREGAQTQKTVISQIVTTLNKLGCSTNITNGNITVLNRTGEKSLVTISNQVLNQIEQGKITVEEITDWINSIMNQLFNLKYILENVYLKLGRKDEMTQDMFGIPIPGMDELFQFPYVPVQDGKSLVSIRIADKVGLSTSEILDRAIKNTRETVVLGSVSDNMLIALRNDNKHGIPSPFVNAEMIPENRLIVPWLTQDVRFYQADYDYSFNGKTMDPISYIKARHFIEVKFGQASHMHVLTSRIYRRNGDRYDVVGTW